MRTHYYRELYQNPQIRLCWFLPMIRRAERTGEGITTKEQIPLRGLDYTIYFKPEVKTSGGSLSLTLRWEDEGEQHSQTIPIVREESHLISGSFVYFFLCPFGYKAKKLFYIGSSFRSRRAFSHRYYRQNLSRQRREVSKGSGDSPYRRYGKEYYKGRITPYGKRCKRFLENEERSLQAFYALAIAITDKAEKPKRK